MTGRALVFAFFVAAGCASTQEQLVQQGGKCTDDLQCATPLVCRCEIIIGTDPDGNEQIIPGSCQHTNFDNTLCQKSDAAADTTPFDSHLPPDDAADAADSADETPQDSAPEVDLDTAPDADLDADGGGG